MIPGGLVLPWGGKVAPWMSNLILWVDGNDAGTFSLTGALVDQWNDKSGHDNHLTPSGTGGNDHRPTKSGDGVVFAANGLALNDVKGMSAPAALIASGPLSYYIVWKRVMARDDVVIQLNGSAYAYLQYSGNWYFADTLQAVAFANDTVAIKSARSDGATEVVRATDGVAHDSQAFSGTPAIQALGASATYAGGFDGTVYECLVYDARISDAGNTHNINYLKTKWGIA